MVHSGFFRLIARSGAAGVSQDALRRVVHLSSETLEDLLRAMVVAGHVNRRAET
jgi:hypothetical protein